MKRFHLSLRFKLTAIVAGVMSVCCLLLTAVSLSTSAHMMEALPLTEPAIVGADGSVTESDGVACEPAVIASAAHSTFRVQNLAAMVLVILAGSAAADPAQLEQLGRLCTALVQERWAAGQDLLGLGAYAALRQGPDAAPVPTKNACPLLGTDVKVY